VSTKVLIEVLNNVRCRISGVPDDVLKKLDDALSEVVEGAQFSKRSRRFGGGWDGKKHFLTRSKLEDGVGTFPKGLLSRLQKLLKQHKLAARVKDHRKDLYEPKLSRVKPDLLKGISMTGIYDYQQKALAAAIEKQSGILWLATNAGKTEIAAAIMHVLRELPVLFIVPKKALLHQTRKRIAERLGTIPEEIGIIGDGRFDPRDITIAIINSVTPKGKPGRKTAARTKKRNEILREYLASVRCVFLDEGHHAKANTWYSLMSALGNAQFRYLLSGTPFGSGSPLMVEAACGPVIYRVTNDELIQRGVSAKPKVRIITINEPDLDDGEPRGWHAVYKDGIVYNQLRNDVIVHETAKLSAEGKSVLVLVRELAQGDILTYALRDRVKHVEFVHGQMPGVAVDEAKERFVERRGNVLVASPIFDEGVDIPDMHALVIADGGQSVRAVLQKVGRGIRKKKTGDNVVEVVDFADCTHRWLAKHSLERYGIYEGEGFDVIEEEAPDVAGTVTTAGRATGGPEDADDGEEDLPSLLREADGRGEVPGAGDAHALGGAAEVDAAGVPEERHGLWWRWRHTA
jgi:superfamily II DNA or RNA helicase